MSYDFSMLLLQRACKSVLLLLMVIDVMTLLMWLEDP